MQPENVANTAVYFKNIFPHKAVAEAATEEKWTGIKVCLGHFRIFGCTAYMLISDNKSKKK